MVHLFSQRRDGNKRLAGPRLDLPKIRKNPLVEIIPINSGSVSVIIVQCVHVQLCFRCLNHCTYCKTKHARGSLVSYSPDEIVNRAKQAFNGNLSVEHAHTVHADTDMCQVHGTLCS